jgi:cystathionine gamma-synthase
MLFPSTEAAARCLDFVLRMAPALLRTSTRIVDLVVDPKNITESLKIAAPSISAVILPEEFFSVAKQYWQHSGDGISSRRGEFCHGLLQEGLLVEKSSLKHATEEQQNFHKGPKRYRRGASIDKTCCPPKIDGPATSGNSEKLHSASNADRESSQFVEERFGRNLDVSFLGNAKSAIKRRIAGSLVGNVDLSTGFSTMMDASTRGVNGLSEDDVYLYPCGMNSIFNAHQLMLQAREPLKSISFGFPYVDTLKILQKFGPGCLFYGNGSSEDLDDLERRLQKGERYLALFAEFPGNPLLQSPDLQRIRKLSLEYDFAVVIDETIGNFINVNVLPYVDVVVSSLTKIFTGECNVMGGSAIFNPQGPYYSKLKDIAMIQYEDNYWAEDVLFMERNSRDFVSRIDRINNNAEAICDLLSSRPVVRKVYYPKCVPSREFYDACRTRNGGYGGLLSVTFHTKAQAIAFFDRIDTAKGPSLGTNFTLTSPYVILAHFMELDWASTFGVDPDLVRISIGLEETSHLKEVFEQALAAAEAA